MCSSRFKTGNDESDFFEGFEEMKCIFVFICQRQCHYEFNTVFQKPCIYLSGKPKEVNPITLDFSTTNKSFDIGTQIYI